MASAGARRAAHQHSITRWEMSCDRCAHLLFGHSGEPSISLFASSDSVSSVPDTHAVTLQLKVFRARVPNEDLDAYKTSFKCFYAFLPLHNGSWSFTIAHGVARIQASIFVLWCSGQAGWLRDLLELVHTKTNI
jgi:hypothetical protein